MIQKINGSKDPFGDSFDSAGSRIFCGYGYPLKNAGRTGIHLFHYPKNVPVNCLVKDPFYPYGLDTRCSALVTTTYTYNIYWAPGEVMLNGNICVHISE